MLEWKLLPLFFAMVCFCSVPFFFVPSEEETCGSWIRDVQWKTCEEIDLKFPLNTPNRSATRKAGWLWRRGYGTFPVACTDVSWMGPVASWYLITRFGPTLWMSPRHWRYRYPRSASENSCFCLVFFSTSIFWLLKADWWLDFAMSTIPQRKLQLFISEGFCWFHQRGFDDFPHETEEQPSSVWTQKKMKCATLGHFTGIWFRNAQHWASTCFILNCNYIPKTLWPKWRNPSQWQWLVMKWNLNCQRRPGLNFTFWTHVDWSPIGFLHRRIDPEESTSLHEHRPKVVVMFMEFVFLGGESLYVQWQQNLNGTHGPFYKSRASRGRQFRKGKKL